MMTNIISTDFDDIAIDMDVELSFVDNGEGSVFTLFYQSLLTRNLARLPHSKQLKQLLQDCFHLARCRSCFVIAVGIIPA